MDLQHDRGSEKGDVCDPGLSAVVPFRFDCHRCGHCCSGGQGYVWLDSGETSSMARFLGLSEARFVEQYVRRVVDPRNGEIALALREDTSGGDAGGRCVLLEGSNACRVYAARPAHCREFPYWPSVLTDERAFEVARATCPGIAVEAPSEVRERAFERLEQLYSDVEECLGDRRVPSECCLSTTESSELFATALEADYAVAERANEAIREAHTGCLLGRARPLGCRLARRAPPKEPMESAHVADRVTGEIRSSREHNQRCGTNAVDTEPGMRREEELSTFFHARLRSIEREMGYPSAYSRLDDLLRARGCRVGEERTPA